jgi:hypothetical protein
LPIIFKAEKLTKIILFNVQPFIQLKHIMGGGRNVKENFCVGLKYSSKISIQIFKIFRIVQTKIILSKGVKSE